MFDPVNSTMDSLEGARRKMDNPVWKDIYSALKRWSQNILIMNPEDYSAFPINGEPDLTYNHCSIQQTFSRGLMVHQVLDKDSEMKKRDDLTTPVRPMLMEYNAMRVANLKRLNI